MRAIVAVPVRDEADRIGACLAALTARQTRPPAAVVLGINNTSDETERVVRALAPSLPVSVHVLVREFAPEEACAGAARRWAMEHAAGLLGEAGVVLTTDADGEVPPDWVAANLYHLANGAEAVAGRAELNAADAAAIPARLHADDALECAYAAALDAIAWAVDPEPWDPWPRHGEHSGASIAVDLRAYRRAGGMPAAPLGEDRAFFAALRRVDARIRHAPEIAVTVSGRIVGRAEGGMADTIRRRLRAPDPFLDTALEPAEDFCRRMRRRAALRAAWRPGDGYFGEAWMHAEGARRPVTAAAVRQELAAARRLLRQIRADDRHLAGVERAE